jgi:hypothetical protein
VELVNLTPHTINDLQGGMDHPVSGQLARVSSTQVEVFPGFFRTTFGEVEGLPEPRPGVLLIVSALVRVACADRSDLISPGEQVRDAEGKPIGCKGFSVNQGFSL